MSQKNKKQTYSPVHRALSMALLRMAVDKGNELENNEPKLKMPKYHGKSSQNSQEIITKGEAKKIAQMIQEDGITLHDYDNVPEIYGISPKTSYLFIVYDENQFVLGSTRYVAVNKVTGEIQYGHDNSEG